MRCATPLDGRIGAPHTILGAEEPEVVCEVAGGLGVVLVGAFLQGRRAGVDGEFAAGTEPGIVAARQRAVVVRDRVHGYSADSVAVALDDGRDVRPVSFFRSRVRRGGATRNRNSLPHEKEPSGAGGRRCSSL